MKAPVFCLFFLVMLLNSCLNIKKQTYFRGDLTNVAADTFNNPISRYELRPGDVLYIKIISLDPRLSAFFNIDQGANVNTQATPSNLYIKGYSVNDTGYVELPVLGIFKAQGLTLAKFKSNVETLVNQMVASSTVIVKMATFKVSVVGEVNQKGYTYFPNERVSIIEALASAGDITVYGKRSNVEIIRQHLDGTYEKGVVNLNDINVVHSPYFYLQPNDIVYVPPTRTLATKYNVANVTLFLASVSTLLLILNYVSK